MTSFVFFYVAYIQVAGVEPPGLTELESAGAVSVHHRLA